MLECEALSVHIKCYAADGKPANLMVAFSTETRLVFSWTLPALATHPDVTVTNFRISWGKTGDPSSSYLLPFSSSTPQQRFTIPSTLEPATRYTIEVIAYYSVPLLISDHAVINGTTVSVGQGEMKLFLYNYTCTLILQCSNYYLSTWS